MSVAADVVIRTPLTSKSALEKNRVMLDADMLARRAMEECERAISLDPEYLRGWAGLAYVYGSRRTPA